ncbi:MarR family winged helix-turn-helix transcriptional regulator [Microbacterium immunditiarum]|uniref:HTH marR-type domain-containing protein n=1 Tax=Microbacterium immunditiarum TaxID=337480 RepID=A0A7Y9GKX7_9MICO|nr:hypothetical protein [Microbacterium immunditiarum]NYE18393.1 hypothetical protein [Microbacterium immunditiarum]
MHSDDFENHDHADSHDEANGTPTQRRPLGYWLRVVDDLLTRRFAEAFANEGVTRRDWMTLNALSGDVDAPGLADRLARKGKHLRRLEERGWIEEQGDGSWALTDEGRAAKERLGAIVDELRARVSGAVSPEDFATTMASIEAIARELGWDEQAWAERGRGFGRRGRRRGRFGGFGPGFGGGFGSGFRHGFGPAFGPGHAHAWHEHGCRGAHGHAHGAHEHGHGRTEHAYERGFDAGYARGREERIA